MDNKDLYDAISQYRDLKEDVLYPFEKSKEEFDFLKHLPKKQNELNRLTRYIKANTTDSDILAYKKNIIRAIIFLKKAAQKNKLGYPLDPNQGLIIKNYIFGKMAGVLRGALSYPHGFSYSQFYYRIDGEFDANPIIDLLAEMEVELNEKQFVDYFELEKFVEEYVNRFHELWDKAGKGRN